MPIHLTDRLLIGGDRGAHSAPAVVAWGPRTTRSAPPRTCSSTMSAQYPATSPTNLGGTRPYRLAQARQVALGNPT